MLFMSLLKPNVTSTWAWAKVFNYLVPICIEIKYYQILRKDVPIPFCYCS